VAGGDSAVSLGDMTVLMVFVDDKFLGVHATARGRAAMDNLSKGFYDKFGPPPPDPSGEVVDNAEAKMWFGENSIVSVQYDPGGDTTSVALLSREMVEQNPEFLVSEDPVQDAGAGDSTEVPICVDPQKFPQSCVP